VTTTAETLVLLVGLSKLHSLIQKICAGLWLNACSYPAVTLWLPAYLVTSGSRLSYVIGAEGLAVGMELILFLGVFGGPPGVATGASRARDCYAIIAANACSFVVGEVLTIARWW
jgi:hypothetical protein